MTRMTTTMGDNTCDTRANYCCHYGHGSLHLNRRLPSNCHLNASVPAIHANAKFLNEYRDANVLCFSETWLDDTTDGQHLHVGGFGAPIRADRTEASGKHKGGGLCCFINERWCNNHTVKRIICIPDVEFFSISFRPFYLPREFSTIFAVVVCVPPSANDSVAAETITQYNYAFNDQKTY